MKWRAKVVGDGTVNREALSRMTVLSREKAARGLTWAAYQNQSKGSAGYADLGYWLRLDGGPPPETHPVYGERFVLVGTVDLKRGRVIAKDPNQKRRTEQ